MNFVEIKKIADSLPCQDASRCVSVAANAKGICSHCFLRAAVHTMADHLTVALATLDKFASWYEGPRVTRGFDEPRVAAKARATLREIRGGDGRDRSEP
jgi:hypothetical protein